MFLGWGCKCFSQGPKTSAAQAQHFVSDPTNVLIPSRSLYNGFCLSHCQKGLVEYVATLCVAGSCSPSCDRLIRVGLLSLNITSAQRSSYLCNKNTQNTQPLHSLRCSPWDFASCAQAGGSFHVRCSPLQLLLLPPGHSYHLTLPCHTSTAHRPRHRGGQHSPEQGCSSWMTCNGCFYISPLCLLFPFFFLPSHPHRRLSSSSAAFLSGPWIVKAQFSLQQKGGGLVVFGIQQKEK